MTSPLAHQKGAALMLALWLMFLLMMISIVFIEKIWRFSESVENIEQSNVAYYEANTMIERSLIGLDREKPWTISLSGSGNTVNGFTGRVFTGGQTMPMAGKGNSPYNKDWNLIELSQPVQIAIPNNIVWGSVNFYFRNPIVSTPHTLSSGSGVINWVLIGSGEVLFATGETQIFRGSDIYNTPTATLARIDSKQGIIASNNSTMSFINFYQTPALGGRLGSNGAACAGNNCILKLSLLRPIPLTGGREIPFLEYRIDFGAGKVVPNQYTILSVDGLSNGYLRSRTIRVPQITTNTALDFGVLQ